MGQLKKINTRLDEVEKAVEQFKKREKAWSSIAYEWVINHKGTSLILSLVLSAVGIYGGAQYKYHLDHQNDGTIRIVDDEIKNKVTPTLNDVDHGVRDVQTRLNTLQPLIEDLIRHEMDKAAALTKNDLEKSLPLVHDVISVARSQNLPIDPAVIRTLGAKLSDVNTGTPGYWPVTSELISYRSALISGLQGWEYFRPCGLNDANRMIAHWIGKNGEPVSAKILSKSDADCFEELDGKRISHWTCTHCVVKYSGGPVSFDDVKFENCLFVFSLPADKAPSDNGQQLNKLLLASDLKSVSIKSL